MASDADRSQNQKAQIFDHLVSAGQWQRVLEMGPELLSSDPNNDYVHQMMTIAALETNDLDMADHHSEMALRLAPEDAFTHQLRARYYREKNRLILAKQCLLKALSIDPEDDDVWCEYGWNCYYRGDIKSARDACQQARSLAPTDVNIELLETAVEGASNEPDRLTAYEQIEAFENTLRLNPESASTFCNIGITYLQNLDDGKNAAEWFRKALAIEPTDPDYLRWMQRAVTRCDPFLKIINFPKNWIVRGINFVDELRLQHPVATLLALPLIAAAGIVALVLGVLWSVFLYLPGKLYEKLTFSEIMQRASGSNHRLRYGIYKLPLWFRLLVFAILSVGFCYGVFWLFTDPRAKPHMETFINVGIFVAFLVGIYLSWRFRDRFNM